MKIIKYVFMIAFFLTHASSIMLAEVCIYKQGPQLFLESLKLLFNRLDISYKVVTTLDKHDIDSLYILPDVFNVPTQQLPKRYIVYQTADLSDRVLTDEEISLLANAIVVWDFSWNNINKYRRSTYNYLYFPFNYEHAELVMLPFLLPVHALDAYKEILSYSNQENTHISSHLPALFVHSFLVKPKLILEAGVQSGESTRSFYKVAQFFKTKLIGIDKEENARQTYALLDRAVFLCMDDTDYRNNEPHDIIFIDTSHLYEHTMSEINLFLPLLSDKGILMFHDSNVTPINGVGYRRPNNTSGCAQGNTPGVTQALKEFFNLRFNEAKYCNFNFIHNGITWNIVHYPFCNGMTVLKKIA